MKCPTSKPGQSHTNGRMTRGIGNGQGRAGIRFPSSTEISRASKLPWAKPSTDDRLSWVGRPKVVHKVIHERLNRIGDDLAQIFLPHHP